MNKSKMATLSVWRQMNRCQVNEKIFYFFLNIKFFTEILLPLEGPGLPDWCKQKGCIVVMLVKTRSNSKDFARPFIIQIRRIDSEDKLWRDSLPTMPARNIPLEALGPESRLPPFLRDPRLDENVTKQSKIYKPRTQVVEDDQEEEGFPHVASVAAVLATIKWLENPGLIFCE
jgi:hypothetical protein